MVLIPDADRQRLLKMFQKPFSRDFADVVEWAYTREQSAGSALTFTPQASGAKADGVTDDTVAIDAAITLASAVFGKVYFPTGIYVHAGDLTINTRVEYAGDGRGKTVIKLKAGSALNVVATKDFATLYNTTSNSGPAQFSIHDLTIDGNKANCPSMKRGLAVYGVEFLIFNVNIQDCNQDGAYLSFRGDSNTKLDKYVILDECFVGYMKIQNCGAVAPTEAAAPIYGGGYGLWVLGLHDSVFTTINIGFCGAGSGTQSGGFRTEHNGNHFDKCHAYGTQQDYSWFLRGQTFLTDCVGEGAKTRDFCIAYKKIQIIGGTAYYPGDSAASAIGFTADSGAGDDLYISGMYIELNNGVFGDFAPAIDFTNMGARATIKCQVNQATGLAYSGTIPSDAFLEIIVRGGATTPSLFQRPGDPSLTPALPQAVADRFVVADATVPDVTKWIRALGGSTGTSVQVLANKMKFIAGNAGGSVAGDDVSMKAALDTAPIDGELLFSLVVGDVTHESYFYAGIRSSSAVPFRGTDCYYWVFGTNASGVQNILLVKRAASVSTTLYTTGGTLTQLLTGAKLWVRFRVRGTHIQMKYWNDGTSEPNAWQLDTVDAGVAAVGLMTFALSGGAAAAVNPFHSLDEAYVYAL